MDERLSKLPAAETENPVLTKLEAAYAGIIPFDLQKHKTGTDGLAAQRESRLAFLRAYEDCCRGLRKTEEEAFATLSEEVRSESYQLRKALKNSI